MTDRLTVDTVNSDQLDALYDQRDRVRAALHIADDGDGTDWQRGYRACSQHALAVLDAADVTPAATEADTAVARVQHLLNTGPIGTCCAHLVRAALGPAKQAAPPPGPCPACRRADQAGLAPDEQHAGCATREQR